MKRMLWFGNDRVERALMLVLQRVNVNNSDRFFFDNKLKRSGDLRCKAERKAGLTR